MNVNVVHGLRHMLSTSPAQERFCKWLTDLETDFHSSYRVLDKRYACPKLQFICNAAELETAQLALGGFLIKGLLQQVDCDNPADNCHKKTDKSGLHRRPPCLPPVLVLSRTKKAIPKKENISWEKKNSYTED